MKRKPRETLIPSSSVHLINKSTCCVYCVANAVLGKKKQKKKNKKNQCFLCPHGTSLQSTERLKIPYKTLSYSMLSDMIDVQGFVR